MSIGNLALEGGNNKIVTLSYEWRIVYVFIVVVVLYICISGYSLGFAPSSFSFSSRFVRWRKRKWRGRADRLSSPLLFLFYFLYFFFFSKANNICARDEKRDDFDPWLLRGYVDGSVQPPKVVGSRGVVGQVYPTTTSLDQRQFPSRLSICVSVCVWARAGCVRSCVIVSLSAVCGCVCT